MTNSFIVSEAIGLIYHRSGLCGYVERGLKVRDPRRVMGGEHDHGPWFLLRLYG